MYVTFYHCERHVILAVSSGPLLIPIPPVSVDQPSIKWTRRSLKSRRTNNARVSLHSISIPYLPRAPVAPAKLLTLHTTIRSLCVFAVVFMHHGIHNILLNSLWTAKNYRHAQGLLYYIYGLLTSSYKHVQ